jgi:hypothetical protein
LVVGEYLVSASFSLIMMVCLFLYVKGLNVKQV